MEKLFAEFKEFVMKGNALDLAIGIIFGAVFSAIWSPLVVINFIIAVFVVFLLVRQINRLKRGPAAQSAEPTTKECPYCLSTIPIKATRCAHCTSNLEQNTA
jgi:large conductance mechanosensitive channel